MTSNIESCITEASIEIETKNSISHESNENFNKKKFLDNTINL